MKWRREARGALESWRRGRLSGLQARAGSWRASLPRFPAFIGDENLEYYSLDRPSKIKRQVVGLNLSFSNNAYFNKAKNKKIETEMA
jgi:hypothetical protein